jgi:hypothetical protein
LRDVLTSPSSAERHPFALPSSEPTTVGTASPSLELVIGRLQGEDVATDTWAWGVLAAIFFSAVCCLVGIYIWSRCQRRESAHGSSVDCLPDLEFSPTLTPEPVDPFSFPERDIEVSSSVEPLSTQRGSATDLFLSSYSRTRHRPKQMQQLAFLTSRVANIVTRPEGTHQASFASLCPLWIYESLRQIIPIPSTLYRNPAWNSAKSSRCKSLRKGWSLYLRMLQSPSRKMSLRRDSSERPGRRLRNLPKFYNHQVLALGHRKVLLESRVANAFVAGYRYKILPLRKRRALSSRHWVLPKRH